MTATETSQASNSEAQRDALHVREFCERMGISNSTFWKAVRQGEIRTVKLCGRVLIPASERERLLAGKAA